MVSLVFFGVSLWELALRSEGRHMLWVFRIGSRHVFWRWPLVPADRIVLCGSLGLWLVECCGTVGRADCRSHRDYQLDSTGYEWVVILETG